MAQYYQVLSQGDKNTVEELRQYYPNLVENQTVQYVIDPEEQAPQFQTQQILFSPDHVMVLENQPQHMILEQTPATYQNPQYAITDNAVEYQNSTQQLFYMEEVDSDQQIQAEQPIPQTQPPVVLNHQLQTTLRNQTNSNSAPPKPNTIARPPLHQVSQPRSLQIQPPVRHALQQNDQDGQQTVTLSDGRVVSLTEYKKMLAESKLRNTAGQERLETPPLIKYKADSPKFKGGRVNRGRSPRRNVTPSNIPNKSGAYVNQDNSTTSFQQRFMAQQMKHLNQPQPKQCVQQFPQQQQIIQQQQTASRQNQTLHQHTSNQPQYVQPQYIIQPPSQHQSQHHRPLPSCVTSSQIRQIIESTPVSEEHSDSIRMLVLLENCEQRLITFTLPKEACTIQEILEQVGVPFYPDTKIECTETNNYGINYLVTVGVQNHENNSNRDMDDSNSKGNDMSADEQVKASSPEPEIEAPQYIPGYLAVCNHCGYTSENFRRCLRCRFKLPEDVKSRPLSSSHGTNGKKDLLVGQSSPEKKLMAKNCIIGSAANKKKKSKLVEPEPVVLTLSSDDEDSSGFQLSENDELIRKISNSSLNSSAIQKEPTPNDIKHNSYEESSYGAKGGGKDDTSDHSDLMTLLNCRTVRIGSYKYFPQENVVVKSSGITLNVPSVNDPNEKKDIIIEKKSIVKVLVNFNKSLPVIFYYVIPSVGLYIREQLGMIEGNDIYFDPLSEEESYRRITLILHYVPEATKSIIRGIYSKPHSIMDELTSGEANDILIKTCPKEISKVIANSGYTEIKQLFIYPPGKGGLSINTEDYLCLAQDQFLNDVIIDFYLKYLVLNLPEETQKKVHVFSTFFYKRLTTKPAKASRRSHPAEVDPSLTAAQKRHARVEKWTKRVNLFEKDFIIIPINENAHWFLAIVCFPGMNGCVTWDGNSIQIEPKEKKKKKVANSGTVTISTINNESEQAIAFDDGNASDKDEAEGDESELDSDDDSDEQDATEPPLETTTPLKRQPIIQASILIFDSLSGASRARVVATLRDYLTCEYKAKMGEEKIFNKDVIKGSCPKVPQQTNFTDCGLYLLQYVEQFFKDPIKDYRVPIKEVKDWFEEFVVTKKREDISLLIKELMVSYNRDPSSLPLILFPTQDGKIVQHDVEEEEYLHDEFDEEEEDDGEYMPEDSEVSDSLNESCEQQVDEEEEDEEICINTTIPPTVGAVTVLTTTAPIRINLNRKDGKPIVKEFDGFANEPVPEAFLKPTISETANNECRNTLSYLKAKRINRHKNSSTDAKRFKSCD
ncbi:hypothetical protein FQA39_LY12345 [Lamprigera yunnana]|nr:hypothetical protein FQA39_LY12345 [Lamprigera yunnana]